MATKNKSKKTQKQGCYFLLEIITPGRDSNSARLHPWLMRCHFATLVPEAGSQNIAVES
jgi:hypothetical protein